MVTIPSSAARRSTALLLGTLFAVALPALLWAATRPWLRVPDVYQIDKLAHAGLFAALALGALLFGGRRRALPTLALLLAAGGLIEVAQSFIPDRCGSFADLAADAAGLGIGYLAACRITVPPKSRPRFNHC